MLWKENKFCIGVLNLQLLVVRDNYWYDRFHAPGEVAEWSNAPDLKSGELKGSVGSNPTLSVEKFSCLLRVSDSELLREVRFPLIFRSLLVFSNKKTPPPECFYRKIGSKALSF